MPFTFRCNEVFDTPSLWWRTGNIKTSFIEIGINKATGAIYDVTVVCLPQISDISLLSNKNLTKNFTSVEKLPICKVEERYKFSEEIEYIDEKKELISYLENDSIFVWFGKFFEISKYYNVDRLSFGTNNRGEICLIRFNSLTKVEIKTLLTR